MPSAQSQGYRFLGSSGAPGVEGFWQRLQAAMPDTGNRRSAEAMVTEWESAEGTR